MLDVKLLRDEPDRVRAALKARNDDPTRVDAILAVDAERRAVQKQADDVRAEQKQAGKDVARLEGDERQALLDRLKGFSDEGARLDERQRALEQQQRELLLRIPNLVHDDVPAGGEEANVVIREWGERPSFDFEPKDHLDIGEALGIIDMERAAKVSGSRFSILRGKGAQLWIAVKRFALDLLEREGHTVVLPPVLVRAEAMEGTGFFPAGEDQIYRLEKDELFLVGTSEVPLAAMHLEEMLDAGELPVRYVAHSACFRREAGAGGKDTRGIFRNHQFEKVEMFVFARAEESWTEHERMTAIEERVMQEFELPYRAVILAAGDTGAPSAKTIDIECWFPGQQRYRETTSCSNTTDYQARRLNVRARGDKGPAFVHTLNGTVATSSRTVAAILENHQRADGSVEIPEALRPYTGFEVIRA